MAETNATPLWLELRKEYIDDNLEQLIRYLKDTPSGSNDTFYQITLKLLKERVEELIRNISSHPIYHEEFKKQELVFNAKLLATYLLIDPQSPLAMEAYAAFMYQLVLMEPQYKYAASIIKTTVTRMCHRKVCQLGYVWSDLNDIALEIFAHKICSNASFAEPQNTPLVFEKSGSAILNQNGLFLFHEQLAHARKIMESGADSMSTGVGVQLRTSTSEKMKNSQCHNIVEMDEYLRDFTQEQHKTKPTATRLNSYFEGDSNILLRITGISPIDNIMQVETVNPKYHRLKGSIRFTKPSLVYYYTSTLHTHFQTGDLIRATLVDATKHFFSIEKELVDHFVNYAKDFLEDDCDHTVRAKLIDIRSNKYIWLTDLGIAVYTSAEEDYQRGDFALVTITNTGTGKFHGMINGCIDAPCDEDFDDKLARHECIEAFTETEDALELQKPQNEDGQLSPVLLKLLLRLFFCYQKNLVKPSERYRFLGTALVMAEMVNDEVSASYIRFASTYLRVLVQFVSNEDISQIELKPDQEYRDAKSTLIRLSVLELLKEYGKKENSEILARAANDFKETMPMLANLARLIQTSNSMQGILSNASLNVIRREIIKTLSLETENEADLEAENKAYLGVESGTQEFKTSMVYPSNNQMLAEEATQNANVLKGVCAFLNSTSGGTLYLGVNDQGYVTGIDMDLKFLHISTIDGYMRYVQDAAIDQLGLDTVSYMKLEPLYDNSVVAIHIEPHPYRVVELDQKAYARMNGETRVMPEQIRLELIAQKVFKDKNKAATISRLQHAFTMKKCVILHNYSSDSPDTCDCDRRVEAFEILPEDNLVIAFDLDRKQTEVFRLNRIGYVEIMEDNGWTHTDEHKPLDVDVFHTTGEQAVSISLQLDSFAKNLLMEEFPKAKKYLKQDPYHHNLWHFTAPVYQVEGVARFYLGLAHHITIVDAPQLKQYVEHYKNSYL